MKRIALRTAAAWGLFFLYVATTQPDKLPLLGLIVPYVLLFLALYSSGRLLEALKGRLGQDRTGVITANRPKRLVLVLSLVAVLLLVLQSIGQLSVRDVITTLAILMLGYLYFARNRFGPEQQPKR